jgi:phospholipid/cholesterol/gamma-HCH transport system ATP-binding protein
MSKSQAAAVRRAADTDSPFLQPISVRNVSMRFGRKTVLDNISLDVTRGEVLAIVGGSGSGKSTLMRIMAMLQAPSAGDVSIFNRTVSSSDNESDMRLRGRLGVMFQHGALFSNLTVLENVCVPLREHTRLSASFIDEIAMLKISLAGLEARAADLYPGELSGGMKKRAAVARGIALDPDILFLDEPSSGLDPVGADAMDELVLELKSTLQLTIILVTHDMNSLWRVADRVLLLSDARIVADGSMEQIAHSDEPAVQAFIQSRRGRAAGGFHGA